MEWIEFEVEGELDAVARYSFLRRLRANADKRKVKVMGFALGKPVRLLLEGTADGVAGTVSYTKMGTVQSERHRNRELYLGLTMRRTVWDASRALVELHQADERCPLADPWTSHRDLLGFRVASFFDRCVWGLDPRWVHIEAGGKALPVAETEERRPLSDLLRTAAAVLGVLPPNRRCFGLFAHLATSVGWHPSAVAAALMVTPRRIRQLRARPEPLLRAARVCAAEPRLWAP